MEQYHLTQDDLFPDTAGQGIWCKKTVAKGKKFSVFFLRMAPNSNWEIQFFFSNVHFLILAKDGREMKEILVLIPFNYEKDKINFALIIVSIVL